MSIYRLGDPEDPTAYRPLRLVNPLDLADQLDARAARYRAAARSAGNRAGRLAYGGPHWARAVGLEAYYTGKAERFRIAAAVIREIRQGKS